MFTNREKADCAEREIAMRRHIYTGWVQVGRMTHQRAEREIALMKAIHEDYTAKAEADEAAGRLL